MRNGFERTHGKRVVAAVAVTVLAGAAIVLVPSFARAQGSNAPPTCLLSVTPTAIPVGSEYTLQWSSQNRAQSASITVDGRPLLPNVAASGTRVVDSGRVGNELDAGPHTFVLTVQNAAGSGSCEATLETRWRQLPTLPIVRGGIARILVPNAQSSAQERNLTIETPAMGTANQATVVTLPLAYFPFDRDPNRSRDEAWYRANRPSWPIYKCQDNTLAGLAHYGPQPRDARGQPIYYTPLDITNPAVREFQIGSLVRPVMARGVLGAYFDNVSAFNFFQRCAVHVDGQVRRVYDPKQFVSAEFAQSVRQWLDEISRRIHAMGGITAINLGYADMRGGALASRAHEALDHFMLLSRTADLVLIEEAFMVGCRPWPSRLDERWVTKFRSLRQVGTERGLVVMEACPGQVESASPDSIEWIIANYLLVRSDRTYLLVAGKDDHSRAGDRPEFHAAIGAPIEEPHEAGGVWIRRYENGLAVLNPSSTASAAVQLGAGSYKDLQGRSRRGAVTLPPATALVLLRSSAP